MNAVDGGTENVDQLLPVAALEWSLMTAPKHNSLRRGTVKFGHSEVQASRTVVVTFIGSITRARISKVHARAQASSMTRSPGSITRTLPKPKAFTDSADDKQCQSCKSCRLEQNPKQRVVCIRSLQVSLFHPAKLAEPTRPYLELPGDIVTRKPE